MWMGTSSCRQSPNGRRRPHLMTKAFLILVLLVVTIHGGDDDDDCSDVDLGSGLIEGGSPAPLYRYPYHVSIRFEGLHACGGVLISRRWLLTIKDCAIRRINRVDHVTVVAGACLDSQEELKISQIVLEEDEGALALMELQEEFNEQFVELNRKFKVKGLILTLMGFGRQGGKTEFSRRLQEVNGLAVQNKRSCVQELPPKLRSRAICVGRVSRACFGDQGAPLILPDPRSPSDPALDKLIGITIFPSGADECGEDKPGVFVNVAKSWKWIFSVIS